MSKTTASEYWWVMCNFYVKFKLKFSFSSLDTAFCYYNYFYTSKLILNYAYFTFLSSSIVLHMKSHREALHACNSYMNTHLIIFVSTWYRWPPSIMRQLFICSNNSTLERQNWERSRADHTSTLNWLDNRSPLSSKMWMWINWPLAKPSIQWAVATQNNNCYF